MADFKAGQEVWVKATFVRYNTPVPGDGPMYAVVNVDVNWSRVGISPELILNPSDYTSPPGTLGAIEADVQAGVPK